MMRISKIGSYLFHPVWIPSIFIFFVFFRIKTSVYALLLSPLQKYVLLASVFCYTAVVPLTVLWLAKRAAWIDSFELKDLKQRKIVYSLLIIYYIIIAQFWNSWEYLHLIRTIIYAVSLSLFTIVVFLNWHSISTHMAGMGILTAGLLFFLNPIFESSFISVLACFILSGFVAVFRLELKAHSENEIYTGYLTGIGIALISFYAFS